MTIEHAADLLDLRRAAREIATPEDPCWLSVLMLFATLKVGPHGRRVAAYLDEPLAKVLPRARRMVKLGIWHGNGKSFTAWWLDDAQADRGAEAATGLLLDAMAVEGQIQRIASDGQRPMYASIEYRPAPALLPTPPMLALPPHQPERSLAEKLEELRAHGFGRSRR